MPLPPAHRPFDIGLNQNIPFKIIAEQVALAHIEQAQRDARLSAGGRR